MHCDKFYPIKQNLPCQKCKERQRFAFLATKQTLALQFKAKLPLQKCNERQRRYIFSNRASLRLKKPSKITLAEKVKSVSDLHFLQHGKLSPQQREQPLADFAFFATRYCRNWRTMCKPTVGNWSVFHFRTLPPTIPLCSLKETKGDDQYGRKSYVRRKYNVGGKTSDR